MAKAVKTYANREHKRIVLSQKNLQRTELLIHFYQARALFSKMFKEYENSGHIIFSDMDVLIEDNLRIVKDISHDLFKESQVSEYDKILQRTFDMMFGIMFHVLLKAKENLRLQEKYDLKRIESDVQHIQNNTIRERTAKEIIDSLQYLKREYITQRSELDEEIQNARFIFDHTMSVFEGILHVYANNSAVLRSLYFQRDMLDDVYPGEGLSQVLRNIYRRGGAMAGYFFLLLDFALSGHDSETIGILEMTLNYAKKEGISSEEVLGIFQRSKRSIMRRPKKDHHHKRYVKDKIDEIEANLKSELLSR